jgi:putative mRNA 3-end processing factor
MEVEFLGGATEVGAMAMVLRKGGSTFLFDYGLQPTSPPRYPAEPPHVDLALLSHAHVDHSGMIPWLCARQRTEVLATPPTVGIGTVLMNDSIKVANAEGFPQPYDAADVQNAEQAFRCLEFGDSVEVGGLEIRAHSAGHIPGATMYELNGRETVLFTGDLSTLDSDLVAGGRSVSCDILVMEATYAGRHHPDRAELRKEFLLKVQEVVSRGGLALVPCFAVGRTQEVLMALARADHEVWLDGMGKRINGLCLGWPSYIRSASDLRRAMGRTRVVRSQRHRAHAMKGEVVVSTSGMLDGGPALSYIQSIADDRRSAILLTGFQVPGSNGRQLLEHGVLDVHGAKLKIECEVGFFDFSAHAGHDDLVDFVEACDPEKVVLCHGDNREALAEALEGREVTMPVEGERLRL